MVQLLGQEIIIGISPETLILPVTCILLLAGRQLEQASRQLQNSNSLIHTVLLSTAPSPVLSFLQVCLEKDVVSGKFVSFFLKNQTNFRFKNGLSYSSGNDFLNYLCTFSVYG